MQLAECQAQLAHNPQRAESGGGLPESADAKAGPAGSNKIRILLFSLGTQETFGINVSNVSEVCRAMPITKPPNMPAGMDGIVSLRGRIIPALNLGKLLGFGGNAPDGLHNMIVAKFNRHILGFLVHKVERIIHVDCNKVRPLEGLLSGSKHMIAAITKLPDGKLVPLLDTARVLAGAFGKDFVDNADPECGGSSPGRDACEGGSNKNTQSVTG